MLVRKTTVGGVLSGFVLAALLVAFFNSPDPGVISGEFEYVQRVVDGDTLLLGTGERVRLIGVDTLESVRPNTPVPQFSKEAADFTRRMVEGKRVRLEYDQANAARGHKDNTQQKRTLKRSPSHCRRKVLMPRSCKSCPMVCKASAQKFGEIAGVIPRE